MLLNYQGSIIAALLGLGLAAYFANRILSIEVTDSKVQSLSDAIRKGCLLYTSPSPRDVEESRMPSSA